MFKSILQNGLRDLTRTGRKEEYDGDDFWADHEPAHHGDPEHLKDEPDFQDGYQWTCCKNLGDAPGCIVTEHVPIDDNRRSRSRLLPKMK